jgi:hypothetical protein
MIDRHKSERAGSAKPKGERPASSEQTRTGSYETRRSAAGNIANSRKVRVPCDQRTGSGIVTLELFASAAAIQPSAAALEAGLMEQERHYPCSAVLP